VVSLFLRRVRPSYIAPGVTEIWVDRKQSVQYSVVLECLFTMSYSWLVPAHQGFRHTGRDVTPIDRFQGLSQP
jgi:hypothetical protein